IVATAVILIGTFVTVFYPMLTPGMHPKLDNLVQYRPLELAGKDIYQREGCMNCHTQTVRPLKTEVMRYGEYSKAGEFAYDRPFLWGSKRTGPDLARIGLRWPVAKLHYSHFEDPQSFAAKSNMPSYGWLKEHALKPASIVAHMDAQGFSYTDEDIKALGGKNELDALVSYMLWLGHAVKPASADASELDAGAALFSDNCSGCHGAEGEGGFGPSLQDKVWLGHDGDIPDERIQEIILTGTDNGMPPYEGAFTDGQIRDLIDHVRSLGGGGEEAAETPSKGAEVFASNCAGCHKPDGSGGFGPNLTDNVWLGMEGDVSDDRIREIISKGTDKGMPSWTGVITDEDINNLIGHICSIGTGSTGSTGDPGGSGGSGASLPKVSGASVYAENCAGCHKSDASGGYGPSLRDNVWFGQEGDITEDRLEEIVSKGTGKGMPPFGDVLDHDELEAVVDFIRSL
ncbi:MAG: cbb3-type cytochrome c oxidase subunit II, partial [Thermodesulfovibrionales bacterium]|nr:cbb3-type cytochrome c oxidase subunit II [Thermodesulfovibrionales bacterium]